MKTKTIISGISQEDLVNLFSTALYGSQWLSSDYNIQAYRALKSANENDCLEDKLAKLLLSGCPIELCDYQSEDEDDFYGELPHMWDEEEWCMVYTITLDDVKIGLQKAFDSDDDWERECAICLILDDACNLDQPRAECLCQLIMFGKQIYE